MPRSFASEPLAAFVNLPSQGRLGGICRMLSVSSVFPLQEGQSCKVLFTSS